MIIFLLKVFTKRNKTKGERQMYKRENKRLNAKDNIEILISNLIDYDNKHHCFKHFVAGFCVCTVLVQILVLIVMITRF